MLSSHLRVYCASLKRALRDVFQTALQYSFLIPQVSTACLVHPIILDLIAQ
jgi:hypothetical protein